MIRISSTMPRAVTLPGVKAMDAPAPDVSVFTDATSKPTTGGLDCPRAGRIEDPARSANVRNSHAYAIEFSPVYNTGHIIPGRHHEHDSQTCFGLLDPSYARRSGF